MLLLGLSGRNQGIHVYLFKDSFYGKALLVYRRGENQARGKERDGMAWGPTQLSKGLFFQYS